MQRPKVSVIVPVYNPGSDVDDCIRTLLGQSLPREEYEVIFVDDGSDDGTAERLDALAAEHENVRVDHIPNSGWPGRPRNVGIAMARGDYVYFVDNDDWLGKEALERLHANALEHDADVVIGKVVGHGKYVPRALFRRDRSDLSIETPVILSLLTPHKLFRRRLLEENGIRFPEGPRRLEDHAFVVHAYLHARKVTVIADYPCYHWVLRDRDGRNASFRPFDPAAYYRNLREVLDVVEQHTEPGPLRDRLLAHWYRGKMLGRVGGRYFARRDDAYRRRVYEEVRELARERYGPEVERWLAPSVRARSRLLLAGDYDALEALASMEAGLRADVRAGARRRSSEALTIPVEARLTGDRAPLRFRRAGERVLWVPPAGVPDLDLDVSDRLPRAKVSVLLRSTGADRADYVLPGSAELRLEPAGEGDELEAVLSGEARVAPGRPPARAGHWEVLASVTVAGFNATGRVRDARGAAPLALRTDASGRAVAEARALPSVAGRLARRMPRLARAARRVRAS